MRLKLTVLGDTGVGADVLVVADAEATIGSLARDLAECLGGAPTATRVHRDTALTLRCLDTRSRAGPDWILLPAAARLGDGSLASGATVALAIGPTRDPAAQVIAQLEVRNGPAARRCHRLVAGTWLLGRDPRCDIVIDDPMVSARHARLRVGETLEVVDLGSANGTRVAGTSIGRAVVPDGESFVLGGSELCVRRLEHDPLPASVGEIRIIRSPRVEPRYVGERLVAPPPPTVPEPERFPWLIALAPLAIGIGLAVMLGRPAALLFALATPAMLLGGFLTQRARRRRRHRVSSETFAQAVAELETALAHTATLEAAARHAEAPATQALLDAAVRRTPLLWTRRPEHWNFLAVRLGTAALPSRTTLDTPALTDHAPEARAHLESLRSRLLPDLPVVERLADAGALGIAGLPSRTGPVLDGILAQLVCLHSPTELVVAAAVATHWVPRLAWLQWLPHSSSVVSPLGELPHLAASPEAAAALIEALELLVQARAVSNTHVPQHGPLDRSDTALDGPGERLRAPTSSAQQLPVVVVVLSGDAPVALERCIALSEAGPDVGIHPIWIAPAHAELPAVCRTTVEVTGDATGTLRFVRPGEIVAPARFDTLAPDMAQSLGRCLAPLVDAGAPTRDSVDLPNVLPFAELLGAAMLDDPGAVLDRWQEHDAVLNRARPPADDPRARGFAAIIGRGRDGPVRLDLREHGPHALVAGTTGAGKSEFLRAWVLALAAEHSPARVTFLFVDYKGGSAFADCVRLPHCVGLVTDLGPRLVHRALVSLRAELRYRERLFARLGAKELVELEVRGHPETPPALVLMIDEFAALAKEVPEFVEGVLDLAQRGRALGMHLVLATQRPAGVVKEGIKANTNLRIALRMAEPADSIDVLGVVDAARLSPALPGRAMVRTGPGRVELVQSAYTGGWSAAGSSEPESRVSPLGFDAVWCAPRTAGESGRNARLTSPSTPTDLQRLVSTIAEAAERMRIPLPRRPWLDELPSRVGLEELLTGSDAAIPLGLSDVPQEQGRRLAVFQPDVDGHLAIIGASGSGKSTALRTLAVATAVTPDGGPVEVFGLDFAAGGLRALEVLPHVGSIVPSDDDERVHRLLRRLGALLAERVALWADADVSALTEFRARAGRATTPRVVLLIDGFPTFREDWEGRSGRADAYEVVREMLAMGRSLGIHVALTADRAGVLPGAVTAAVQCRVQLRDATEAGAPSAAPRDTRPPGWGVVAGLETQIALLEGDGQVASPGEDSRAIAEYARRHRDAIPTADPVRSLPRQFAATELPAVVRGRPVLGIAEDTLEPVGFDPRGSFIVAGSPGSGRTNALEWIAHALRSADPAIRLLHFGPRGSPLAEGRAFDESMLEPPAVAEAARALLTTANHDVRLAVVIESVAGFVGTEAEAPLVEVLRRLRPLGGLVIAEEQFAGWGGVSSLLLDLKSARRGLLLRPEATEAEMLLRVALPRAARMPLPPGRGVLVEQGHSVTVQLPHMASVG